MKIRQIELILENCEIIRFPGKYIGYFSVDKIKSAIQNVGFDSICKRSICESFVIEIHKDADSPFFDFMTKFDRLQLYHDICQIEFTLYDPARNDVYKHYRFEVYWSDKDGNNNLAQEEYRSENGHLYIAVDKRLKKKDIFDLLPKGIDDKDYGWPWGSIL
jgi:hypothetical protein